MPSNDGMNWRRKKHGAPTEDVSEFPPKARGVYEESPQMKPLLVSIVHGRLKKQELHESGEESKKRNVKRLNKIVHGGQGGSERSLGTSIKRQELRRTSRGRKSHHP